MTGKTKTAAKVSICVPVYRQVEFLATALESIRIQDFDDYEVVITDDTPDDSVEALVGKYLDDDRWSYFRNPRRMGSPANWNEAVSRSRGEYVKMLHHDDYFVGSKSLGAFVALLERHPTLAIGFSATEVRDVKSGTSRIHRPTFEDIAEFSRHPAKLFAGNLIGAPSATIYRRSLGLSYDERFKWLVDVDFYIRALSCHASIAFHSDPLVATPSNAAHQVTELVRGDVKVDLGEHLLLFEKLNPEDWPLLQQTWLRLFYRYGILSAEQLANEFSLPPHLEGYFSKVFERAQGRTGALNKYAYLAYKRLPQSVRLALRSTWKSVKWRS